MYLHTLHTACIIKPNFFVVLGAVVNTPLEFGSQSSAMYLPGPPPDIQHLFNRLCFLLPCFFTVYFTHVCRTTLHQVGTQALRKDAVTSIYRYFQTAQLSTALRHFMTF